MAITVEVAGVCRKKIIMSLSSEEVKGSYRGELAKAQGSFQMRGYRPGTVPMKIVENRFGKEIVDDLKNELISREFNKAMREHKFYPLGRPEIDIKKFGLEEGFEAQLLVDVSPEVNVEYKGLAVEEFKAVVEDVQVEAFEKELLRAYTQLEDVTGAIADNDWFTCDVVIKSGDAELHKEEELQLSTISRHVGPFAVPELGTSVKGLKSGDSKDIPITISQTHSIEANRGKEAILTIKILDVRREKLPEVTDAFVKERFHQDSIENFRKEIRKNLEERQQAEYRQVAQRKLVEGLVAKATFDLPENLVADETVRVKAVRAQELVEASQRPGPDNKPSQPITLEDAKKKVEEEFKDADKKLVVDNIREVFILAHIAQKENVQVTQPEVDRVIEMYAANYGVPAKKFREVLQQNESLDSIELNLRNSKVMHRVYELATVTKIDAPAKKS